MILKNACYPRFRKKEHPIVGVPVAKPTVILDSLYPELRDGTNRNITT